MYCIMYFGGEHSIPMYCHVHEVTFTHTSLPCLHRANLTTMRTASLALSPWSVGTCNINMYNYTVANSWSKLYFFCIAQHPLCTFSSFHIWFGKIWFGSWDCTCIHNIYIHVDDIAVVHFRSLFLLPFALTPLPPSLPPSLPVSLPSSASWCGLTLSPSVQLCQWQRRHECIWPVSEIQVESHVSPIQVYMYVTDKFPSTKMPFKRCF